MAAISGWNLETGGITAIDGRFLGASWDIVYHIIYLNFPRSGTVKSRYFLSENTVLFDEGKMYI
jgi:hypothetical protein